MAPIQPPAGTVFVPRVKGVNRAAELFEAAHKVGADVHTGIRSTMNGYHVSEEVAEQDEKDHPEHYEVDTIETIPGTEGEPPVEIEGVPAEDGDENRTPADLTLADGSKPELDENGVPIVPVVGDDEKEDADELEPLPVNAGSSNKEIDDYADSLDPKVDLSSASNRAEKIALLEAARTPKTPDAE